MIEIYRLDYESPIGIIEIAGTEEMIYSIMYAEQDTIKNPMQEETPTVLKQCYQELDEYFKKKRETFAFPYHLEGTAFQTKVWNALTDIPYGETNSYRDVAQSIGSEHAVRAVGSANGKNKINIAVPCHRVIGANGKLTGYGGGLWRKEWLLKHEGLIK